MDFWKKLKRFFRTTPARKQVEQRRELLRSSYLGRTVEVELFLPSNLSAATQLPLLVFNDGQDSTALRIEPTLQDLFDAGAIPDCMVVGVHAADRLQEYGTHLQLDYQQRGQRANAYVQFVLRELLPWLEYEFPITTNPAQRFFFGFSLGGLSAFDIVWNYPNAFGAVGVFSGALWWRHQPFRAEDPDADRIVHDMVNADAFRPGLRFWLQTGTRDETDDRNQNGIIDSIDDTNDLILLLEQKGYRNDGYEIRYVEVLDGEHNQQTWAQVLPQFLLWCFQAPDITGLENQEDHMAATKM